ncbi:hypothetical protein [Nocardioides sp. J54]|uniref:hypothetical protein n=1 Tax=Nocardioides sp. J54 TaxID=935866 RepID=UPI0004907741|nr:hypothetical protein [Nocardioides sp. J54]
MTEDALDRLRQTRALQEFRANGTGPWTVVYSSWRDDAGNGAYFSAFSEPGRRAEAVADASWDFHIGYGLPGFSQSYGEGGTETHYHRYGTDDGLEPLVLMQEFHGGLPDMLPQLSEEFRLYHNLWMSPDAAKLIKLSDDGTEYVAATVSSTEVRIRTNLLKQFQAGRQLDLLLFTDSVQFVEDLADADTVDYDALDIEIEGDQERISFTAQRHLGGGMRKGPFSRLLGTRVLPAPEQRHAGVWPFDETSPEHYPEFIIGEDENGRPVRHTCDPDTLANYFGKNPDAPHYLTPVFFRRDVLQKYYEDSRKFTVSDGRLRCAGLWSVQIDNDHPDHIVVFLGDLGRDLPESERDHWRSQNITPTSSMSSTNIRRSFLAQPTWPEAPDLRFKYRYDKLRADWPKALGWDLFREPVEADAHVIKRLRIPLNESQPEFEAQILNLAKVMIDALNDSAIDAVLPNKIKDERSIAKLKRWLDHESYPYADGDVAVLQKVQRLRSRAAAHRKGSDYDDFLAAELGSDSLAWGFAKLLVEAIEVLIHLRAHFLPGLTDDS